MAVVVKSVFLLGLTKHSGAFSANKSFQEVSLQLKVLGHRFCYIASLRRRILTTNFFTLLRHDLIFIIFVTICGITWISEVMVACILTATETVWSVTTLLNGRRNSKINSCKSAYSFILRFLFHEMVSCNNHYPCLSSKYHPSAWLLMNIKCA